MAKYAPSLGDALKTSSGNVLIHEHSVRYNLGIECMNGRLSCDVFEFLVGIDARFMIGCCGRIT